MRREQNPTSDSSVTETPASHSTKVPSAPGTSQGSTLNPDDSAAGSSISVTDARQESTSGPTTVPSGTTVVPETSSKSASPSAPLFRAQRLRKLRTLSELELPRLPAL